MSKLALKPLSQSELYNRRQTPINGNNAIENSTKPTGIALAKCERCAEKFANNELIVNSSHHLWHRNCFRCAQCFRLLNDSIHYYVDGRYYCEYDFQVLYAPSCGKCQEFIIGRVIKALNSNWHPACFLCENCNKEMQIDGVYRFYGKALCRQCNDAVKSKVGRQLCFKCHGDIDENRHLKYRQNHYHPYHFKCKQCNEELDETGEVVDDSDFYCRRCYNHMCTICAACRHPIDNERIVDALGKKWHYEHFMCAHCEKPFLGARFLEKRGRAYCERDYHQLFGDCCFACQMPLTGDSLRMFAKCWCAACFACTFCNRKFDKKTKVIEFDMRPICKHCYDSLPKELRKRIIDAQQNNQSKNKKT